MELVLDAITHMGAFRFRSHEPQGGVDDHSSLPPLVLLKKQIEN
eukprot:COSAG01_NODE_72708_length_252_cov_0.679739_1_plen_43_part_10